MPILLHPSPVQDQLAYDRVAAPGVEATPLRWRANELGIDWSCTRARRRRFNNRSPMATWPCGVEGWNSGYWAAVLIAPTHAVCCAHYRRAVPQQVNDLTFIGRTGQVHRPSVRAVEELVGDDLDLIEFDAPLPDDVMACSRIADLRAVKKGAPVLLQTSQHMSVLMSIEHVTVIQETGGARWPQALYLADTRNGTDDLFRVDDRVYWWSGDSGSPVMSFDADGVQCFVGFAAAGGPISMGGTKWPGNEFDVLCDRVGKRGYQLHPVELGGVPIRFRADADGDGVVDQADLATVIARWGEGGGLGDVNRDGQVDGKDLAEVLAGWRDEPVS